MMGPRTETGSCRGKVRGEIPWIEVVNLPVRRERNFAAKVYAFNAGQERVKGLNYEIIGNLDSDVSLEKDHFEFLLHKFKEDARSRCRGNSFQRGKWLQLGNR